MAVYSFRAMDRLQDAVEGTITADSARGARDLLRSRGLLVESLREQTERTRTISGPFFVGQGHATRITSFVQELATLLSVGVSIIDALDALADQHRGAFQTSILLVRERVAEGAPLAEALAAQPGVFDELTVNMVEVGENAGNLEEVLAQLADFKERSLEIKDRVLSALLYPAIVFAMAVAVALFLMGAVVPMLLENLVEAGRELPWPTRLLKTLSDLLIHHGLLLALMVVAVILALAALLRTEAGRMALSRTMLRLPLVGSMVQKQAISRIAMVLSTLLRSGIVYVKAAQIAADATRNLVYRRALIESCRRIQAGSDLGDALAETGVFPPLVVHIFAVGQTSGKLEDMLDRLASGYDRQVARLAGRLASVLEPVLILLLVVFVGFILFATLLPILEAGNVL